MLAVPQPRATRRLPQRPLPAGGAVLAARPDRALERGPLRLHLRPSGAAREGQKYSERQIFEKFFPNAYRAPSTDIACNNANAALRRDVWLENRFDEQLTGLEDMELAKRLVAKDWLIGYVAETPVVHIHEETWQQVRIRYERESYALQRILPEIHMTFWDMLRYCASAVGHDLASAARDRKLARVISEILMFRSMQYWGAYRGSDDHRKLSRSKKDEYYYYSRRRTAEAASSGRFGSGVGAATIGSLRALKAEE